MRFGFPIRAERPWVKIVDWPEACGPIVGIYGYCNCVELLVLIEHRGSCRQDY